MKLATLVLFTMTAGVFSAAVPQKAVIVTYTDGTPDHIINDAKNAITAAGGFITHEYNLIKGFAAKAPAKVLESVLAWGVKFNAIVEEDQVIQVI